MADPTAVVAPLLAVTSAGAAAALLLPAPRGLGPPGEPTDGGTGPHRLGADPAGRTGDGTVLRVVATVAVSAGGLLLVGGAPGAVVSALAGAVTWWLVGRLEPASVRQRRERLVAAVPHAVDLLAACLAAGLSPGAAVEQVVGAIEPPLSEELGAITRRLRLGVDPVTVWRDVAAHPQLGGLGRTVSRATESGASVSEAMLRLAEDQRRRGRAETENRARAVGVKAAVPLGVCLLPAFVLVGVVPLVAGSLSVLLTR